MWGKPSLRGKLTWFFLCFGNVHRRVAPSFFSVPLTVAVTTLSSFQGYRKTQAVTADCLMTDAKGTKRALIASSPVKAFQQASGKTETEEARESK